MKCFIPEDVINGVEKRNKILIIDDELDLIDVLYLRFQCAGFDVESASSGTEGLHKIQQFKPDLILLDLMMPDMDGWSFCRRFRKKKEFADIPVIIFTGLHSLNCEEMKETFGVDRVLLKASSGYDLVATAKEVMAQNG